MSLHPAARRRSIYIIICSVLQLLLSAVFFQNMITILFLRHMANLHPVDRGVALVVVLCLYLYFVLRDHRICTEPAAAERHEQLLIETSDHLAAKPSHVSRL